LLDFTRHGQPGSTNPSRGPFPSREAYLGWAVEWKRMVQGPNSAPVVHSDPRIMGGALVFRGTRVPVQALFDYVEAGDPLERFLDHFPTVSRQQAIAALEEAARLMRESAGCF